MSAPVEIPEGFAKTPWRRDPLLPRTILDADGRTLFTAHKSGRVGDIGTALATADLLFLAPQMAAELLALRADVTRLTASLAAAEGEAGRLREAAQVLIDPEAGEIDRRLAAKDVRSALSDPAS